MGKKSLRTVKSRRISASTAYSTTLDLIQGGGEISSSVIVLTALIDVGLEKQLKLRMRKMSSSDFEGLFSGSGPLSGLSAKIKMAFALGVIGPLTRNDLTTINEVRNLFAHAPSKITLRTKRLWQRIEGMHSVLPLLSLSRFAKEPLTRERRLLLAMSAYVSALSATEARRGSVERRDGIGLEFSQLIGM